MTWITNSAGALSQFINALTGGNRDQSLSSRSWEAKLLGKSWAKIMVLIINAIMLSRTHCLDAYNSDTERTYT